MKAKKNLVKVVSGVLSTGILTASCTQYLPLNSYVYGEIDNINFDLGQIAIPLSIQLRSEDIQYIKAIQAITTEIINSPQKAQEFNENTKEVLAQYGYWGNINLDDDMLKITKALADADIYEAVKNKDFKLFVNRCMEKNILSSNTILSNDFYKGQLDKIYQSDDYKKISKQLKESSMLRGSSVREAFLVAAIAAVIIGFVAALAYFVYAVNAMWTASIVPGNGPISNDLSTLDVYTLREGMEHTYIAVDSYTEEIVNNLMSIINETDANYFKTHSEAETRNLLKINILNNL